LKKLLHLFLVLILSSMQIAHAQSSSSKVESERTVLTSGLQKFYPNPIIQGSDMTIEYNMDISGEILIFILDALGNIKFQQRENLKSGYNEFLLGINMLEKGVYMMKIKDATSNDVTVKKIIIK